MKQVQFLLIVTIFSIVSFYYPKDSDYGSDYFFVVSGYIFVWNIWKAYKIKRLEISKLIDIKSALNDFE